MISTCEQRLQARAEAGLRLAHALRDRADAALVERVQVEHPVGLAEPHRAQDDRLASWSAAGHGPSVRARPRRESSRRPSTVEALMAGSAMYSTRWCGYCVRAKALLDGSGSTYEEVLAGREPDFRASCST